MKHIQLGILNHTFLVPGIPAAGPIFPNVKWTEFQYSHSLIWWWCVHKRWSRLLNKQIWKLYGWSWPFFFCYSSSKKHPFLFRFLSVCVQNIVWFRDLPLFEGPNIQSYFIDDFLPYFLGSITFLSFRNMVYKMVVHISSIIVQRPENIKVLCIFWACFVRLEKPVWVFLSPLNAH